MRFRDRRDAGRRLAEALGPRVDSVVLGLPRGGIPVAYEVARALGAPLDVFLVRKLGVPGHEELAMGAIASGGIEVLNDEVVAALHITPEAIGAVRRVEEQELRRRQGEYRASRKLPPLGGRTVILVDDGLATGSTMRAATAAVRKLGPARVVVAVPVGAPSTCDALRAEADEVVCLQSPAVFHAVGQFYEDFAQTGDEEVKELLAEAQKAEASLCVPVGAVRVTADLVLPAGAQGLVVFAHGSGSGRMSPRNREVALRLQRLPLATLLVDLLSPQEAEEDARSGRLSFDIAFLAARLRAIREWTETRPEISGLDLGYFGASTGGAAALVASVGEPRVKAVVSRGGRPDLAGADLSRVTVPTLLIVGGRDLTVLELNQQARSRMGAPVTLEVVPGATHLFEEPGTLEEAASLAARFFARYLGAGLASAAGVRGSRA